MISTRLTEYLHIKHPVIQAPMAFAAGGRLANAVSAAGGLGFIGGAYGDELWLSEQFNLVDHQSVGCGFITWALKQKPWLLDRVLEQQPAAIFLSFGNPVQFVDNIKAAGVTLICQVQTLCDAKHVIGLGADIVVAQGAEAGGHGEKRATFTLVPEIADYIASHAPDTLLCAAGGIGDGRGIAAALMLGADGVVVGSRFWAAQEALVHPGMWKAAIDADGDDTIRTSVVDIVRQLDWSERYNARVLKNDFSARWHQNNSGLKAVLKEQALKWQNALVKGDTTIANAFVGEVAGLIHQIEPAGNILEWMTRQASLHLKNTTTLLD